MTRDGKTQIIGPEGPKGAVGADGPKGWILPDPDQTPPGVVVIRDGKAEGLDEAFQEALRAYQPSPQSVSKRSK